jgi:hypothetical protein
MLDFDIIAYYKLNFLALQLEEGELSTEALESKILKRVSSKALRDQLEFKASFQTLIGLLYEQDSSTRPELIHTYVYTLLFLCERYSRIISRGKKHDYEHTGLGFEDAFISKWNSTLIKLLRIRTNPRVNYLAIKALLVSLEPKFQPSLFTADQIKQGVKALEAGTIDEIIEYVLYCLESNQDKLFIKLKSLVNCTKYRIAEYPGCVARLIVEWKARFNRLWASLMKLKSPVPESNPSIASSQFIFIHDLVIQIYTVAKVQFASQPAIFEPIARLALKSLEVASLPDKLAWLSSSALEPSKLLFQLIRASYYCKNHALIVFLSDKIWNQLLAILLPCWEYLISLEFNEQVDIEKYYVIISRLLDIIKHLTILNPTYPNLSDNQKEAILLNGIKMIRFLDILSELQNSCSVGEFEKVIQSSVIQSSVIQSQCTHSNRFCLQRLEPYFDTFKDASTKSSSFTQLLTTCFEVVGGILVRSPRLPAPTARSRYLHCVYSRFEDLMIKQGFVEIMLLRLARVPLILSRNNEAKLFQVRDLEYNLVKCLDLFWHFDFDVSEMQFINGRSLTTVLGPIFRSINQRIEMATDLIYGDSMDTATSMTDARLVNIAINSLKHPIFYKFTNAAQLSNLVLNFPLIYLIETYTKHTPPNSKLAALIKSWLQRLKSCILQNSIQSNLIKGDKFTLKFIGWLLRLLNLADCEEKSFILEVISAILAVIADKAFDYTILEQLILKPAGLKELGIEVADLPVWLQGAVKCKDKAYSIYFTDLIAACTVDWFPLHTRYEPCECSKNNLNCIALSLINSLDRLASVQAFKSFTLQEFQSVWGRNLVDLTGISKDFDKCITSSKAPRSEVDQILRAMTSFLTHSLYNSNNFLKAVQCGKIFELCFPLVANSYLFAAWYDNQPLKTMLIRVNKTLTQPLIKLYTTQVQTSPRSKATELAYHSILLITRLGQIRVNPLVRGIHFNLRELKLVDNIQFPLLERTGDCEVLRFCMILQATVIGDDRFPFNFDSSSPPIIDSANQFKPPDNDVHIVAGILDFVNGLNPMDLMTPHQFDDPVSIRVQSSETERIFIVSKAVLMHISPVFQMMLTQDFVEGRTEAIELEGEVYSNINIFITQLTFVYENLKSLRVKKNCRQLALAEALTEMCMASPTLKYKELSSSKRSALVEELDKGSQPWATPRISQNLRLKSLFSKRRFFVEGCPPSAEALIATIDLVLFCDKWQIPTMVESNLQYFYHSILLYAKEQLSPITKSNFLSVLKRLFDLIIDYGLGTSLHYEILFPPSGSSLANGVKLVICCHFISLLTWIITKSDWLQGDRCKEKFGAVRRFILDCLQNQLEPFLLLPCKDFRQFD